MTAARSRSYRAHSGPPNSAATGSQIVRRSFGEGELRRPHPYRSCGPAPIEEWAQVNVIRVTVSDRQEPAETAPYGTQMARYEHRQMRMTALRPGGRYQFLRLSGCTPHRDFSQAQGAKVARMASTNSGTAQ